jgi:hypothetical protein
VHDVPPALVGDPRLPSSNCSFFYDEEYPNDYNDYGKENTQPDVGFPDQPNLLHFSIFRQLVPQPLLYGIDAEVDLDN